MPEARIIFDKEEVRRLVAEYAAKWELDEKKVRADERARLTEALTEAGFPPGMWPAAMLAVFDAS